MPEMVLLPSGEVLIINGVGTGYASTFGVRDLVGQSNADHPILTPSLYTPSAPRGKRITNKGPPTSAIPRMYHSGVTLTPMGNLFVAGSNSNLFFNNNTVFNSSVISLVFLVKHSPGNCPTGSFEQSISTFLIRPWTVQFCVASLRRFGTIDNSRSPWISLVVSGPAR